MVKSATIMLLNQELLDLIYIKFGVRGHAGAGVFVARPMTV